MTTGLDRYREQRRNDMHANVTQALKELDAEGQPINITRVAAAAGVSRQWLYASPFRCEIEELRNRAPRKTGNAGPARAAASDASLRGQLHALRERLKELKAENQRLRAELECALGLVRDVRHS
jgi:Family of unknown function (DUF6262)